MKFTITNVAFDPAAKIPAETPGGKGYLTPIQIALNALMGEAADPTKIGIEYIPALPAATTVDQYEVAARMGERLTRTLNSAKSGIGNSDSVIMFATTKIAAFDVTVYTTTGYARLIKADGTLGVQVGLGSPGSSLTINIPAGPGLRAVGIMSVANGGSIPSGWITQCMLADAEISYILRVPYSVTSFVVNNNNLVELSLLNCSYLTMFTATNNVLRSLDLTGCVALNYVDLTGNQLSSLDWSTFTVNYITLTNNRFTELNVAGKDTLVNLIAPDNLITSVDMTGCTAMSGITLANNTGLTSIVGVGSFYTGAFTGALSFNNTGLTAAQIDAIFTALPISYGGTIVLVQGNPGSGTCDPQIAIEKGWTVSTGLE